MRHKSGPEKQPAEDAIKDIRTGDASTLFGRGRRSASCWKGSAARRALPDCVAAKTSPRRCTMAGRKSSWKPARDGLPATRRALRPLTR